jgi:hypothetical protein
LKNQARKIGVSADDQLCPWNPARIIHAVQTLVLKGGADAVIAGCQAEDFFNDGLPKGNRVLLEFPGMGHMPFIRKQDGFLLETETKWEIAYQNLLAKFANASVSVYRESIKSELETLRGIDRTPERGGRVQCSGMEPGDG